MSVYEWADLLSMRRWPVPGHSTMYSAEAGGKAVSDDLINRLQGKYSVGPKGVYEDRDFGSFTPAICKEAAEEITRLRAQLAGAEVQEAVTFTCHGNSAPAYSCNKPGDMSGTYYRIPAPAKVPEGWVLFPVRAWEFLQGINDLEGCDFGEPNPKRKGKFWWRRAISEMLKSQGGE